MSRPAADPDWRGAAAPRRAARLGGALLGSLLLHGGTLAVGLGLLAAATQPELLQGAATPAVYEVVLAGAAEIAAENPAVEPAAAEPAAAAPVVEPVAAPVIEPIMEPAAAAPVMAAVEPPPEPPPAPELPAPELAAPPEPQPPEPQPEPPPVAAPPPPPPVVAQPPVKPATATAPAKPRPPRPTTHAVAPPGSGGGRATPAAVSAVANAPGPAAETASHSAQALRQPPPLYPAAARRRGLEGVVLLRVRVAPSGAVEAVEVASSSGAALLDDAARDAVRGWTFRPAMRLGIAVAAVVEAPVRFRLDDP